MKKTLSLLLCLTMLLGVVSLFAATGASVEKSGETVYPSLDLNSNTPITYSVEGEDFPVPNATLAGSVSVGDHTLEYVYTGDAIDRDFFVGYCADLEKAGYAALGAEAYANSSARTYVNTAKGITVHVLQSAGDDSLRLTVASTDDVVLPPAEILSQQTYTATADTKLTVSKVSKNGDSYVFTLADGSFVVVDASAGGFTNKNAATELWDTLVALNGGASANDPIYVRAWLIARERKSRYSCFEDFIKTYGANAGFKMDYVLFNRADAAEYGACVNAEQGALSAENLALLQEICDFDYIKVHTGQVFYFVNLKVEVLYTHEDVYPATIERFDDTTTIFRTTLTEIGGTSLKPVSYTSVATWLGTANLSAGNIMAANWGAAIKSDMVQLSHQGAVAVETSVYDLIAPTTVLYAGGEQRYNAMMTNTSYTEWAYKTDRYAVNGLTTVKNIIFNDTESVSFDPATAAWTTLSGDAVVFAAHGEYSAFIEQALASDINLNNYRFIYGAEMTASGKDHITQVMNKIKAIASMTLLRLADTAAVNAKEVLVGETNRAETATALSMIDGEGWIITVINNKIVIVGTDKNLTRVALTYFETNYAVASNMNGMVMHVPTVHSESVRMQTVSATVTNSFKIIYNDYVDDLPGVDEEWFINEWGRSPDDMGGGYVDYIYEVAYSLRAYLASAAGVSIDKYTLCPNAEVDKYGAYIMVGAVNRADYMAELRKLSANEYGVVVKGNKIMVLAWNEVTLDAAYNEFKELLENSLVNGKYVLPVNAQIVKKLDGANWPTDFPMPDTKGVDLTTTLDVGGWQVNTLANRPIRETLFNVTSPTNLATYASDTSLHYVFTGEGVNRAAFLAYCAQLQAAGYEALAQENYDAVSGFSGQSFFNSTTGIYLHVYHTPYNYSAGLTVDEGINALHVVAAYADGTKIGTTTISGVQVPDASILAPQAYENITVTKIVTFGLHGEGMGYVLVLADGSFVILDGGLAASSSYDHAADLWTLLNALHREAKGAAASASDPIHVRLWIMTHEHGDHYGAFIDFMNDLKADSTMRSQFKMDYFFYNDPSASEAYGSNNTNLSIITPSTIANWGKKGGAYVNDGFTHIAPQTGQVFYFANMKLEVLYTYADAFPRKHAWGNNTSTVYRTTFTVTDASGTNETSCVWFGDGEALVGQRVEGLWGDSLKSDAVQLAHHGSFGIEYSVYERIAPTIVFFPGNKSRYDNSMNPKSDSTMTYESNGIIGQGGDTSKTMVHGYSLWNYTVNRRVLTELASVDLVIFNMDRAWNNTNASGQSISVCLYGNGVDKNVYVAGTTTKVTQTTIPSSWSNSSFDQVMKRSALDGDIWR